MITQSALKEVLHYNPESGDFTWLKVAGRGDIVGRLAGGIEVLGYRRIRIFRKMYKAHRLAWLYTYGSFPADQIDHINGIRDDNRLANLRTVTNAENGRNTKMHSDNTSGVVGVHWDKRDEAWRAKISDSGKQLHLGYFKDLVSAVAARKSAELKYDYHQNHGRGV